MSETIDIQVLNKIKKARRGTLFFIDSFISISNSDAIRKALERLLKSVEINRVATGIYVRPEIDRFIGPLTPNVESIEKAIAKRDRARIVPTGQYALNLLKHYEVPGYTSAKKMSIKRKRNIAAWVNEHLMAMLFKNK